MSDLVIYFGLVDFILIALLVVGVAGGVGWWFGRRNHRPSLALTSKWLELLPYGAVVVQTQVKSLPTVISANAEVEHLWGGPFPTTLSDTLVRLIHETQTGGYRVCALDAPTGLTLQARSASMDARHTLLILEDLTARKQQESFYQNFIRNVSHELKTPLTVIQGHVAALSDRMADDEARQTSQRIVAQEAARLTQLVDNLLLLSRLEMPDFDIERRLVNLEAMAEDAILQLSDLAETRAIAIDFQCERPIPRLMADRARLKQVLINLLDNGIKYNHEGGRVTVHLSADASHIVLKVTDTGEGIPPQDLPHIFEKLYRVERHDGRYVEGSGLGLAIVQHIVTKHGGQIAVESEVGVGTTFTLSLPRVEDTSHPEK